MDRVARKYYHDLKLFIPTRGKSEKRFLNDIRLRLMELSETFPALTYGQICDELEDPRELAVDYFSGVDSEHMIKKLRFAQCIRYFILCCITALLILTSVRSYYFRQLYLEVQDTIVTETKTIIE